MNKEAIKAWAKENRIAAAIVVIITLGGLIGLIQFAVK